MIEFGVVYRQRLGRLWGIALCVACHGPRRL